MTVTAMSQIDDVNAFSWFNLHQATSKMKVLVTVTNADAWYKRVPRYTSSYKLIFDGSFESP